MLARAPAPARVSAASKVPFELRKKAERIYEQAVKDRDEGRLASAVMNAKLAINFDPTVPSYKEFHEELLRQRAGAAAPPRARPDDVPRELALFGQANDAEGRGEYEKAVKLLREAIDLNPKAAALHNKLGVVLSIRLKRHEEALGHLKQAVDLEPGSVVYMNNFSKVTGLLESVLENDPKARKKKGALDDGGGRVEIKKIRPLKF
jgi:Flp pilus assembly protein TadD